MQLTLLESDRSFLRSAECAALSIVAHLALIWVVLAAGQGGFRLPVTERDARVFFLLPPDRVPASERQTEVPRVGKLGSGLGEGQAPAPGEGFRIQAATRRARHTGEQSGPRSDLPTNPTPFVPDSVYSVLQVDQMVERFESSAVPVYPPELVRLGTEGQVEATYVVDTTGHAEPNSFKVMKSTHPAFAEPAKEAIIKGVFKPAKFKGQPVRQLVQQRISFKVGQ